MKLVLGLRRAAGQQADLDALIAAQQYPALVSSARPEYWRLPDTSQRICRLRLDGRKNSYTGRRSHSTVSSFGGGRLTQAVVSTVETLHIDLPRFDVVTISIIFSHSFDLIREPLAESCSILHGWTRWWWPAIAGQLISPWSAIAG